MTADWRSDEALPPTARSALATYCDTLAEALGDALRSVVLYGPVAKGDEYHAPTTRVDTLVVLREVNVAALDAIAPALKAAQKHARLTVMVVTEADLRRSTDVFPSKFIDMRSHHRLLHGADPLSGLEVADEHLRLRCEQELKNLMLRLRTLYVRHASDRPRLLEVLAEAGATFADLLRMLLVLRAGDAPLKRAEVVSKTGDLGIDARVLEELLAVGRGRHKPEGGELKGMLDRLLVAVDKAAQLADTHGEGGGAA